MPLSERPLFSQAQLESDFPLIPTPHIRAVMQENNMLYAPTYLVLRQQQATVPQPYKRLTRARSKGKGKGVRRYDEELEAEMRWVQEKVEEEEVRRVTEVAEELECVLLVPAFVARVDVVLMLYLAVSSHSQKASHPRPAHPAQAPEAARPHRPPWFIPSTPPAQRQTAHFSTPTITRHPRSRAHRLPVPRVRLAPKEPPHARPSPAHKGSHGEGAKGR